MRVHRLLVLCTLAGCSGGPSVSTGDGPSAPTNLTMTAQTATSTSLSWDAATPGPAPIDHYRVYRNGVAYATASGTSYADSAAPGCQIATLDAPATAYDYAVAAVDTKGNEGPRTTQYAVWGFRGAKGGSAWGKSDYSYGLVSLDWSDTSGAPVGGGTDIKVVYPANTGGGFQPYSNEPQVPVYDLELGAFRYFTFDIKAEHAANDFFISVLSRLPFGDVFDWVDVRVARYATLADNTWTTVKIPLEDFHEGTGTFTGSIGAPYGTANGQPYATLHVTSVGSGSGVDNGGFVVGSGLPGGVFVVGADQNASVGTFQVQGRGVDGSTTVASRTMTFQRTNMYKFNLGLNWGMPGGAVYLNNIGFTSE